MKALRNNALQVSLSSLVLLFLLGHGQGWWHIQAITRLDQFIYAQRMVLAMPSTPDPRVVIVDIDEKSLEEVGRWPWGRHVMARLVEQLSTTYHVGTVGFDIVFAEKDETSGLPVLQQLAQNDFKDDAAFQTKLAKLRPQLDYDQRFANALAGKPVVLGYYFSQDGRSVGALPAAALSQTAFNDATQAIIQANGFGGNLPPLQQNARGAGFFNAEPDSDGVIRRVAMLRQFGDQYYESLALAVVRSHLNHPPIEPQFAHDVVGGKGYLEGLKVGPLRFPLDERGRALVAFRGAQKQFQYISASDVLSGRADKAALEGRIVLIGTTAPGLKDLRVVPVDPAYPGVEIHANVISNILEGNVAAELVDANLQLLVLGVLAAWLLIYFRAAVASVWILGLTIFVLTVNFLLWQHEHIALPVAATLLAIAAIYAVNMACGYFFVARNKRQMASLFGQYAPPELVERMSAEPKKYSMEGQSRELTVLFSDVRGFTTLAEGMEPKDLARFMNEFLTALTEVIRVQHLGTIDKYIGDCVMAFWGAPVDDEKHASHAVLAGLDMLRAIEALGPSLQQQGWPAIQIGVGINTGRMTVGDMGSKLRKSYTVMGDAVNLASRLEGITKYYGVGLVVGATTRDAVGDAVIFRELDRIRVKGREEPITIYEPLCRATDASPSVLAELADFHFALACYRRRDWQAAEQALHALLAESPDCTLYRTYLARIAELRGQTLTADWDGVQAFDSK